MSSVMYGPAWSERSQPVLALTTRTMSVIAVPLVVVPSRSAQCAWPLSTLFQPQAIICIVVGPHQ